MKSLVRIFLRCHSTVPRAQFGRLSSSDIKFFRSVVGKEGLIDEDLERFNNDWTRQIKGAAPLALQPKSTEQVSSILRYCNERRIAVVPQGGNTGLVGGSIAVYDEIVLSMSKMNQILNFDLYSGIVLCEAGCVLENLANFLSEKGFVMPLDLGAKGTCQIGGNVSTNAGGLRLVRYGSLHGNVVGLEVVLADGSVLDGGALLRKDNTGYDMKQLFIGAEGTLGVVTKVAILAPRKPAAVNVAVLGVRDYAGVLAIMLRARSQLMEVLSAVEFWDSDSMNLANRYLVGLRAPFPSQFPFYVLIETSGSNQEHDMEKLSKFLADGFQEKLIEDGVVAQDEAQAAALWKIREGLNYSAAQHGHVFKYDVSVPVDQMYSLVEATKIRLPHLTVIGYGHLGDGNLHLNVVSPRFDQGVENMLEPWIFEQVAELKGSVSAEHGIGRCKTQFLHLSKSPQMITSMRQLKQLFDPNGILNPYKVLPS